MVSEEDSNGAKPDVDTREYVAYEAAKRDRYDLVALLQVGRLAVGANEADALAKDVRVTQGGRYVADKEGDDLRASRRPPA